MNPRDPDADGAPKKVPKPKIVFESEYDRNPLTFLSKPWVQKSIFWAALLGTLLYLRSFFALIFLTFLFAILIEAVVERTPNLMPIRRVRVVLVFLLLLGTWVVLGFYMIPRISAEVERARKQVPVLKAKYERFLEELKEDEEEPEEDPAGLAGAKTPTGATGVVSPPSTEPGAGALAPPRKAAPKSPPAAPEKDPTGDPTKPPAGEAGSASGPGGAGETAAKEAGEEGADAPVALGEGGLLAEKPTEKRKRAQWAELLLSLGLHDAFSEDNIEEFIGTKSGELLGFVPSAFGHVMWALTVFFLSHVFSFLIIWDWPRLVRGYRRLEKTRAGPFFEVARETFSPFGKVLAQALGAQFVIALLNTALTAVGMALLKIPMIEVLSIVVFICSFIPVAGVFISSAPICLVALANSGFQTMIIFVVVVVVVHMIEAYILNPRIYGAHLNMNPFVVLVLLVVAHHMLGLWGLLLATPVTAYIFHHVLKLPEDDKSKEPPSKSPPGEPPTSRDSGGEEASVAASG